MHLKDSGNIHVIDRKNIHPHQKFRNQWIPNFNCTGLKKAEIQVPEGETKRKHKQRWLPPRKHRTAFHPPQYVIPFPARPSSATGLRVCVYSLLMYHKFADTVTLESARAGNQRAVPQLGGTDASHSHNAVCIWKVPPGSWPVPAEGYLPTAVIVCNYRANLFSSAGSGW